MINNDKAKIFLIGFNKCATRSFTFLFGRNGLSTCHWKVPGSDQTIAQRIISNASLGKPALDGISEYTVYSDMTFLDFHCFIDMPLILPLLNRSYPEAFYIFQYRAIDKWIESRVNHGTFMKRMSSVYSQPNTDALKDLMRKQFFYYKDYARTTLKGSRYMEFELESAPLDELVSFLQGTFCINTSFWTHKGETRKAQARSRLQSDRSAASQASPQ
jgi:hypothetical protein